METVVKHSITNILSTCVWCLLHALVWTLSPNGYIALSHIVIILSAHGELLTPYCYFSLSPLNHNLHRSLHGASLGAYTGWLGGHHTHSHGIDSCHACMWMKPGRDHSFSLNKVLTEKTLYLYFLIYNWPLLCYLGSEIGCCLLDCCWFLTTKQQWNLSDF